MLMACELIVFIILLTYTSSRQSVTATTTSHNTPTCVQELTPRSSSESHRPVPSTIDMSASPRRRRSVDDPSTQCGDVKQQQHVIKSGECDNDVNHLQ